MQTQILTKELFPQLETFFDTAKELKDCDVLMLAQFSMANAWNAVSEQLDIPILTAPDAAVKLMKQKFLGNVGKVDL